MDQTLKYGSWAISGTAGGRIGASSCATARPAGSNKSRVRANRNPRCSIIGFKLHADNGAARQLGELCPGAEHGFPYSPPRHQDTKNLAKKGTDSRAGST